MKILIAGLGSIGRRHLRNLQTLGETDILLYRTGRSTLPDDELSGLPVETDLQAALAQMPQAVIVANPTAYHLDVAIPAAEHGCALLLEKPISHSLEGVDALCRAVWNGGGAVLVGFQFRYHPGLLRIKDLLEQAAIGKPLAVRAHWGEYLPGWHPWEDYRQGYSARADLGGGVTLTLSHPLDYLGWLFGDVQSLWAFTARSGSLDMDVEDQAEIGLRFANGVLGSVHLDYLQRPRSHHLEIIGSRGTIHWQDDPSAPDNGAVHCWQASPSAKWQVASIPQNYERNDMFMAEMRHFLQIIRRQETPCCTLDDGIRALRLALGALESQATGQQVEF